MTHILQKLRDDVAGKKTGMPGCRNDALNDVLDLIDALIADQPEPDELLARLRSFAAWYVSCAGGNVPPEAADADAAADLITSQQAENTAMREAGQAVVDRWDSPDWSDHRHTADFINALRATLTRKDTA